MSGPRAILRYQSSVIWPTADKLNKPINSSVTGTQNYVTEVFGNTDPEWVKSKLGSLYSVFTPFFPFKLYLFKLTFTFILFEYHNNCGLDEMRMILSVSPVYHPHGPE